MNNTIRKSIHVFLSYCLICALMAVLSGCGTGTGKTYNPLEGVETRDFRDDTGRTLEIPAEITRIAASGTTAQMVLMAIAPDYLVGLSSSPSTKQMPYFPEEMIYLPTFGQFYGSKSNLNQEALVEAQPQLILDIGDKKASAVSDLGQIQDQTGIPTIYLDGTLPGLANTYRTLGELFGREEEGEALASYIEETLSYAEGIRSQIPESDVKRIYYGTGSSSLNCNASGSSQADVIDIIGAMNAIQVPEKEITNKGGGTTVNLEEIYTVDPDVMIFEKGGQYEDVKENEWSGLTAVQSGQYYEIPNEPYSWMSSPPSVNRVLGIWWLGQLIYPEYYKDYDIVDKAIEYYSLFWHYDLTREEAESMLTNSR